MTTLRRYHPLPKLEEIDPGLEPGLDFVLILPAKPQEKIKTASGVEFHVPGQTLRDEAGAAVECLLVSQGANAQTDWAGSAHPSPYENGNTILTRRYPASCEYTGADGRMYLIIPQRDVLGRRTKPAGEPIEQNSGLAA